MSIAMTRKAERCDWEWVKGIRTICREFTFILFIGQPTKKFQLMKNCRFLAAFTVTMGCVSTDPSIWVNNWTV